VHKDAKRPTHFIQFWSVDMDVHFGNDMRKQVTVWCFALCGHAFGHI